MGGMGSGSWIRTGMRRKVESMLSLDIKDIANQLRIDINDSSELEKVVRVSIAGTSWTAKFDGSHLRLQSYWQNTTGSNSEENFWIQILRTPCNLGGKRSWFQCPECWARVAKLYFDNDLWKCRKCGRLTYNSQSEDTFDRLFRRRRGFQRRVYERTGITFPTRTKPKNMHWKTFLRICYEEHRLRAQLLARLTQYVEGS